MHLGTSTERVPRNSMKILLALSCLVNAASAFTATSSSTVYDNLRSTELIRASDSSPVKITDQWRSSSPFGLGDKTAVLAFLRHYG